MVKMRVGQHDRRDRRRVDGQRLPVALAQLFQSLEQTAVDEDPVSVDLQQVLGAGDGSGRAEERQRRHFFTLRNR